MNSTAIENTVMLIGNNPILGVLSFIAAIISIFLALIFYKYGKAIKKPNYTIKNHNLIKDFVNKIDLLDIKYSGKPIKNFTISRIAFWNAGNETIDADDVVNADPIIIHVKNNNKILDANIIALNNLSNCFSLSDVYDECKIKINFDYIDKDNGVAIQVYHTGSSDEDIEVSGRIKGVGRPHFVSLKVSLKDTLKLAIICLLITSFLSIIFLIARSLLYNYNPLDNLLDIVISIIIMTYIAYAIILSALSTMGTDKKGKANILANKIFSKEPEGLEVVEVPPHDEYNIEPNLRPL
jgi:hypothetical protein